MHAHTYMEHALPSNAHMIVLQMYLTHWFKFDPKFCTQILHQCIISSPWAEPTKSDVMTNNSIVKTSTD